MFTKFQTDIEKILLDPDVETNPKGERFAVILSPALYWVRRFKLPVRSEKEARKLLPSLFEEFLPEGEFRYYGYFDGDEYIAFAYEEGKIRQLLNQKGIDALRVEGFYFAQNECREDDCAIELDGRWVMEKVNGIVLKLPFTQKEEKKPLDLKELPLSKKKVHIERFDSPIEKKTLYVLYSFFILFTLLYAVQYYKIDQEIDKVQTRSKTLYKRYDLLPTTIQNRSILKKYEKIDKYQKKIRLVLASLFKLPYKNGMVLEKLSVEKKRVRARFGNVKDTRIFQRLQRYNPNIKQIKNSKLIVEIAL